LHGLSINVPREPSTLTSRAGIAEPSLLSGSGNRLLRVLLGQSPLATAARPRPQDFTIRFRAIAARPGRPYPRSSGKPMRSPIHFQAFFLRFSPSWLIVGPDVIGRLAASIRTGCRGRMGLPGVSDAIIRLFS